MDGIVILYSIMKNILFAMVVFIINVRAEHPTVSIIQLICSPEKYDGKVVRFQGVLRLEFEGNAIYLSKEHFKHSVTTCGLWLNISDVMAEERKWGNGEYFFIEGTFHASDKGHMGLWMGAISDITKLTQH